MGSGRLVLLLGLASCRQLPELIENECSNGVLERGEDCDRFSQFSGNTACDVPTCRYLCDYYRTSDDPKDCPPGRECGRDNLCRLPSGSYQEPLAPLAFAASELLVADVDGDSTVDLIGGAPHVIDVRYGVGDGTFRESFSIAIDVPRGERTLGDVDGDGIQDLIVPYLLGINVFAGDETRRLIPDAHPQVELSDFIAAGPVEDVRFLVARVGRPIPAPGALWTDGNDLNLILGREDRRIARAPATGARITSAIVDELTDAAGEELVVAIEGESRLWLAQLESVTFTSLDLAPFGTLAAEPLHLVDLDGDARKDILVLVHDDGVSRALVLKNNGASFGAPIEEPRFSGCSPGCWPLAAGSESGSSVFVLPDVILTSTVPGSLAMPVYLNLPTSWTLAAVADFNGDGSLDVAATDDISHAVSFLYRSDARAFNRIDVPLPVAPRRISAGDYDGDTVSDLACVLGREFDELHVVFGETSGPPSDAVFMARFTGVGQIQATYFLAPAPWNPDRIHDLIVEVTDGLGGVPKEAAILIGTGRRRMNAPVPLGSDEIGFRAPHHVRAGRLNGDDNHRDLMALTLDGRIWVLSNRGGARFETESTALWTSTAGESLCGFSAKERPAGCATIDMGPIVEDDLNLDEAILSDRSALCPALPDPIDLGLIDTTGGSLGCTRIDAAPLVGSRTELMKTKLAFVNSDSAIDLVLILGGASPAVVVGFGDGTGSFPVRTEIGDIGTPYDATEVGGSQLAILTNTGLHVATFGPLFPEEQPVVTHVAEMSIDSNGRVLAAKVNFDGLDDLVFSSDGRIYIFAGAEGFEGDKLDPPPTE